MINDTLKIATTTRYRYPHGAVYLGPSSEMLSSGFLEIAPGQATPKMTRPLPEHIKQTSGSCEIEMFDEQNKITIKKLNPGDTFVIPTNIIRVHRNRFSQPSLNYWEYQGNALKLIAQTKQEGILDEKFSLPRQSLGVGGPTSLPIQPNQCELYRLPTAKIYIGKSDLSESYGFLELKPGMAMDKHSYPVAENLTQVNGTSEVEMFADSGQITITKLTSGQTLTIPANQHHVHSNKGPADSLTFWHFAGDVSSIIADIKSQGIHINNV